MTRKTRPWSGPASAALRPKHGRRVLTFAALLFRKFCLGAYIYHVLRGQSAFANATLPWARRQS